MELPAKLLILTDPHEIKQAVKAGDLISALWDFDNWLRSEYKYQGNEAAYDIRQKMHEILQESYSISLDDLLM